MKNKLTLIETFYITVLMWAILAPFGLTISILWLLGMVSDNSLIFITVLYLLAYSPTVLAFLLRNEEKDLKLTAERVKIFKESQDKSYLKHIIKSIIANN